MPSALGHSLIGLSLVPFRPYKGQLLSTMFLSMAAASIPDLDVIGFEFGIRYGDALGHRGFSHSLLFGCLLGSLIAWAFFKNTRQSILQYFLVSIYFSIICISHGVFDAMTDGGLGIGFFIPFEDTRYFFSYRPIPVSPLNVSAFFTEFGWNILKAEISFLGTISFFILLGGGIWRRSFEDELFYAD